MTPHAAAVEPIRVLIVGFAVSLFNSVQEASVAIMARAAKATKPFHVVTANPEVLMQGRGDVAYGNVLRRADMILPDGIGVVWSAKAQGVSWAKRLPGIEVATALLEHAARYQLPVALYGASPETQTALPDALQAQFPGLPVVFAHHGHVPAESDPEQELAQLAAGAQPWLMLVALGSPKQDAWISRYAQLFSPGVVMMGVGGSFDVWAGTVQRAPKVFQTLQMEWVWRLANQPWRIQRSMPPLLRFAWDSIVLKRNRAAY
jgi:N-acetylglucosaminyldiphosphoundecaprenol N-acetyl-beta-D-mannosaminyltransferase